MSSPVVSPTRASARSALGGRAGAFTLIELLTVIAVIGILAAILIPTVGAARVQANKAKSTSNLRQIATACMAYSADNKGNLPNAKDGTGGKTWPVSDWQYQVGLYAQAVTVGTPNTLAQWADGLYRCPLKTDWSLDPSLSPPDRYRVSYSLNAFELNSSNPAKTVRLNSILNPTTTWLVGTSGAGYVAVYNKTFLHWRDPNPRYKEGHLVAFCDASVKYVPLNHINTDLSYSADVVP